MRYRVTRLSFCGLESDLRLELPTKAEERDVAELLTADLVEAEV